MISSRYPLVSKKNNHHHTSLSSMGLTDAQGFLWMVGMCSVEPLPITLRIAKKLAASGVRFFRAGAFKPRTNPYDFQGLGEAGLQILDEVKKQCGMRIVTEVLSESQVDRVAEVADVLQVGTRNMFHTPLLKALGRIQKPVLLKRHFSATLNEWLQAAEYILLSGNPNVILCERGVRSGFEHSRNLLDIAAIVEAKRLSHLPVVADPSHAAGRADLVAPLSMSAVAAGAQGLLLEVHDTPEEAYSDAQQALTLEAFVALKTQVTAYRDYQQETCVV